MDASLRAEDFAPLLGGADHGEAFFESSRGLGIGFEDSKVEDIASSAETGLSLRYLRRSGAAIETSLGSSARFDPAEAARLAQDLLGRKPAPGAPLKALERRGGPVRLLPSSVPLERKVALLAEVDALVRRNFPHVRQVSLGYGERERDVLILDGEGNRRAESRTSVVFTVGVVAEKDGVLQTGREVLGALKGWELFEDGAHLRAARQAAHRALSKLSAPVARAGEMTVILSSAAGGTFIHEAIGHSLEADHVQEGVSPAYRGKVGQVVAPEAISVIDDPTLPFQRGSFAFDDEGVEARPTLLVERGILKDYLYDRSTALREGRPSNGHGRRESYLCRPIPRMSNLYVAPGKDDPRRILRELDAGLLVTRMGGGEVDTATGEFVFEVDEGFEIKDGEILRLVRDANLMGEGPAVLRSIDRVGWDIGWGLGTCGKAGQGVPVGDGQPTLRLPRLLVGGRHG